MANFFEYDLYQLAVGVLYLNLGRAGVDFPSVTRAHPSYHVHVTLTPGDGVLDGSHKRLFPFLVRWDIWQNVVVPLFADGAGLVKVGVEKNSTLRQQINAAYLLSKDHAPLIAKIQQLLLVNYQTSGYVPVGTTEEG